MTRADESLIRIRTKARRAAAWALLLLPAGVQASPPPPVIDRPAEVFWGSYRRNEHLVDGGASQWTWVRQNLDGLLLHGAYWNTATNTIGSPSPDVVGPKLAALLNEAGGRKIILEHGLAGNYPDIDSAFGSSAAGNPAAAAGFSSGVPNIKRLMNYGFPLPEISTDYIMEAWKQSVRMHPEWTSKEFFTALTGAWEAYDGGQFDTTPGSGDRLTYGWFRQWTEGLAAAFPGIRVTSTNSPVYFNWEEDGVNRRELGGDLNNFHAWLKITRRGDEIRTWYSGEGTTWRQLSSTTIPLGASPVAGLFVASTDGARLAQARFDNLTVLPFQVDTIGRAGRGGEATVSGSTYTLKGWGNEALHPGNNTQDAQAFAWKDWDGDGVFTVRLDSLANSNSGRTNPAGEIASAGIAIRESGSRDSRQVALLANFANQLEFLTRPTTGAGLAAVTGSGSPLANLGVRDGARWLRLSRTGNTLTAAHSTDNLTWQTVGSTTVAFPNRIQVGMVADSQVRFEQATAVFSNVSFVTPLASSFSGSDIGSPGPGSTSSLSGSTHTLKARGTGLAASADAARLVATGLTGDGTIQVRLAWFADDASAALPLPAGAQMGLTLRASTAAGAPHTSICFTPQLGLRALSRTAGGGTTAENAATGAGEVAIHPLGANYRPLLRYFTGNAFMKGLHEAFPATFSPNFAGFTTDSPYAGYQKWGGSETHPDALNHRRKIILYERWLQQRGRIHQFIANSAGGSDFTGLDTSTQAGRDAWDLTYKNGSLRSIQLHQLEGGRPDRVIFESWYDGPFTIVPESANGSFANLAMDGLKYLKGPGQNLDLAWRVGAETTFAGELLYQDAPSGVQRRSWPAAHASDSTTVTVRLTNRGEVAALPVIHAHESGGGGWLTTYQTGAADVTTAIRSAAGHPLTDAALHSGNELIAPGASVEITLTIQASQPQAAREVLLRAFWNPQDPSAAVRDSLALTLLPPNTAPATGSTTISTPPATSVDVDLRPLASDAETAASGLWFGDLTATHGTVELLPDGHTARFTPAAGFTGSTSFSYRVRDAATDPRLLRHFDFEPPDSPADDLATDLALAGVDGPLVRGGSGSVAYQNLTPAPLAGARQVSMRLVEDGAANHARLTSELPAGEWNLSTQPWTFSCWLRRATTDTHDFILHVGSGNGFSGDGDELQLIAPANSSVLSVEYWNASNVSTGLIQSASGAAPADVWTHVALTWTPATGSTGTLRLFVNGSPAGETVFNAAFKQNVPINFGGIRTSAPDPRHFNGWLDDVALFRNALDPAAISRLASMAVVHQTGLETTGSVNVQVNSFAAGLLAHWPFDADFNDISGQLRHLSPGGSPTLGAPARNGAAAMQAATSGSHAATPASVPLGDAFTISTWALIPSTSSGIRTIASNSASGFNTNGFRWFVTSSTAADGRVVFETGNGTLAANVSSAAGSFAFDRWQHLAVAVDRAAGTATLYRNGLPLATGSARTDFANLAAVRMGAMTTNTHSLRGTLDHALLHGRIVGAAEMAALAAEDNTSPTISGPGDLTLAAGSSSAALTVTIDDLETPASLLTLGAVSSDGILLPPQALVLAGEGSARTLTLSPVAFRAGTATITLTVSDGLVSAETSFSVTVTNGGFPARWTSTLSDATLPWSVPAYWANEAPPWPGNACELDFLTGITAPADDIHSLHDLTSAPYPLPFTLRRVILGGSGPATGSASHEATGAALRLVNQGSGTPALDLTADGPLHHRLAMPFELAATLNVAGAGTAAFEIAGPVSGSAGIVKNGPATLSLSGANTFGGLLDIAGGRLRAADSAALGATSGITIVRGGTSLAALELTGGINSAEPIRLDMQNQSTHSHIINVEGHNTLSGSLSLNSGGGRWDIASLAGSLTLTGAISNIVTPSADNWRTLHLKGPGTGVITGTMSNSSSNNLLLVNVASGGWTLAGASKTYTGATTVAGGSLRVDTNIASPVIVQSGAGFEGSGSTSGNLTVQNNAQLLVRLADWNNPPAPFTAARLITTGVTNLPVTIDATGLAGFSETTRTINLITTTVEAPNTGAATLPVNAVDFPGAGSWSAAVSGNHLRLTYHPDLYAAWRDGIDWLGGDPSPGGDPDADGTPNLLEYALAGNPLLPDPATLPRVESTGGRLRLSFTRIADPTLIYQVEGTNDLAPGVWIPFWSSTGPQNTAGQVVVDDELIVPAPAMRFIRLKVSR